MLQLSEVIALAQMLEVDKANPNEQYNSTDTQLVSALTGLPVRRASGSCKSCLVIGREWVIKFTDPGARSGVDEELNHIASLPPDLQAHFALTHYAAPGVSVQEYLHINERWYDQHEDEIC
jgi:hypothetical protein